MLFIIQTIAVARKEKSVTDATQKEAIVGKANTGMAVNLN